MIAHTDCRAVIVAEEYAHEVEDFKNTISGLEHVLVRGKNYERWLEGQVQFITIDKYK